MTRIPCTVRRFADGYLPFVTFSILQPPLYVTIDALVDTGSPFTVLSPKDALSTRLPLSRMRSGPTIGLAGCTFFRHNIGTVALHFRKEDGRLLSVEVPSMNVLVPTKMDSKTLEQVEAIPSLVGTDLLKDKGWSLYFNPGANRAYLEIP